MNCWQITDKKQLNKISKVENLENIDDIKVKVTKCFITMKDVNIFLGEEISNYPIIPGFIAVGQITETLNESNYFVKGQKVYLTPENSNGYLKEFAVVNKKNCHVLPQTVTESEALFINHLSIALTVIDELKIDKGEYVGIVGGSILGNVIAQLLTYYKAVPIIIDDDEANLEISRKTDVYYSIKADKSTEKQVIDITGGRKCKKVIYITDSDLPFDYAIQLASNKSDIAVTGITQTNQKFNLNTAFTKDLRIRFISKGDDNVETAINLLVQKAVNVNNFNLNDYKFEYISKHFENAGKKFETDTTKTEFTVNLL
ncbi:MAG: hypothetical protein J6Q38_06275 [Clostridia bacterium]|nr:hypothetical protein [Clostridia bacterium]